MANWHFWLIGLMGGLSITTFAQDALGDLQAEITRQQTKVAEKQQSKAVLQKEIQQFLQTLTLTQQKLHTLEQRLSENQTHQRRLEQEERQLALQFQQQKKALAILVQKIAQRKLKPNFVEDIFREDREKHLILKQDLHYLYKQKTALLTELQQTENALLARKDAISQQKKRVLQQTASAQKLAEQQQLARENYQQSLNRLQTQLHEEEQKLQQLKANEKALREKIAQAERQAKKLQAEKDLGTPRHQYKMPVKGTVIYAFASPQLGELRWRGIVIKSPKGTKVEAIAHGQVIFAGKLAGYGLMVIIKHGKTDLTLYGYNHALNVKTGDIVEKGQVIAEVGWINGEQRSGLYFEISRRGEGIDPMGFLAI